MALKQISTSQVELGMFIHSFRGSWFRHPFWRARFLLTDRHRLQAVRQSEVNAVVIDTARGRDVYEEEAMSIAAPPSGSLLVPSNKIGRWRSPRRPAALEPAADTSASPPSPIYREFGQAQQVAGKARKVISKVFFEARLGNAPRVAEVAPVVEDIHASIERNPHAFHVLMRCRTETEATYQHMLAVSALMVTLAKQMELSQRDTHEAGMTGLLLDIGVSRLEIDPAAFERGVDNLDPKLWHRHCEVGYDLLKRSREMPKALLQAVMRHHEHVDGTGFPDSLPGRELDRLSRMAAICDRFDILVSGAATGHPLDPAEAMNTMMLSERAFDHAILGQFQDALGLYPVGSFVTLRSGKVAMVVAQDARDPALPTVRVFHSAATGQPIAEKTLALASRQGVDAIIGIADLAALGLPDPAELRTRLFGAG